MLAVIFRNRYFVNTAHLAICKQEAVLLVARRKFRGVQLASAGYYLSRKKNFRFRTLEAIVPSHSFAKNHSSPAAYLLLNFIRCISLRKRKAYTWEVAQARMRLQQQFDE